MALFLKDPSASLDYAVDWAAANLDGQTIVASQWTVVPQEAAGVSLASMSAATTRTSAVVSGGIPGHVYRITNFVTFSDARSDERQLTLRVEQR